MKESNPPPLSFPHPFSPPMYFLVLVMISLCLSLSDLMLPLGVFLNKRHEILGRKGDAARRISNGAYAYGLVEIHWVKPRRKTTEGDGLRRDGSPSAPGSPRGDYSSFEFFATW
ncbi:Hypothetical predicted protein [Podarcis lilfordi]|uniref:Uncharacterized protein n=1 Tax=Podarcis lilfordi TaxID=74358 RepID=A0AA35KKW8_9SAUR|nr:Hypothetical predicted protein [Podarcis lilfordi]